MFVFFNTLVRPSKNSVPHPTIEKASKPSFNLFLVHDPYKIRHSLNISIMEFSSCGKMPPVRKIKMFTCF